MVTVQAEDHCDRVFISPHFKVGNIQQYRIWDAQTGNMLCDVMVYGANVDSHQIYQFLGAYLIKRLVNTKKVNGEKMNTTAPLVSAADLVESALSCIWFFSLLLLTSTT